MSLKNTLLGGIAIATISISPSLANGTDLPFVMHDVIVTSHTPSINITVRNVAASTNPADRDLRVISNAEVDINIQGQVWCNSYDFAETAALQAHGLVRHVEMVSLPGGGSGPFTFALGGGELPDHTQEFNGTNTLENFDINMPIEIPQNWDSDALIDLGWFNPVREVEEHLEQFVGNNAGTHADFLRHDDVFEVQLPISAVGWCQYDSGNMNNDYAGARYINVTARIFYQGDDDIQNVIGTVAGGSGDIAAQVPNRARGSATTRGTTGTPPARNTRPARARVETVDDDRASSDDNEAALLLPAVQRAREASRRSGSETNKPARLDKQQAGRGRTRARATVDANAAVASGAIEWSGSDGDDAAIGVSPSSLLLPAVAAGIAERGDSTPQAGDPLPTEEVTLGYTGVALATERASDRRAAETEREGLPFRDVDGDQPQATPVDALRVINHASEPQSAADPLPTEELTLGYAGVEPDEID